MIQRSSPDSAFVVMSSQIRWPVCGVLALSRVRPKSVGPLPDGALLPPRDPDSPGLQQQMRKREKGDKSATDAAKKKCKTGSGLLSPHEHRCGGFRCHQKDT